MHIQDSGQWPPQSQNTTNISLIDTSIETQTRACALAPSEKEYTLFYNANGAGPIEGNRNDAGSIIGTGNPAGQIEGIRYNAGSIVDNGNVAEPTEGIDLNKTPAQKSKRKKHRPKVLKEEKPLKTPKSTTPKPSKGKEEKTSGKRKYVRKKTPAGQPPPEQAADSNCRAEVKPVRQCLNFDGQYNQENAQSGSQAQVKKISTDLKDFQPSVYSIDQRDVQSQLACHVDSTTSSMYSSANQMANTQLLPAHNTQKGMLIDLNSTMSQIQNEHTNFVDNPAQFFRSGIRESLETNPLLKLHDGVQHKNVPDLNSSISLLQNMSTNFAGCLLSSPQASLRQIQMANQMLHGHGMPENPITQHFEGACTSEAVISGQMLNSCILTKDHTPPATIEGNSVMGNLNKLVTKDDYLSINASPYMYTGTTLEPHDFHDSSHIQATRRAHNASNSAQTLLDGNFNNQNNGLLPVNACHPTTSEASYFPASYKRMRSDNQGYSLNGVVDNCSTMPAYLSNNLNGNMASAINSNIFTLADAQKLIAREKSRAAQKMISFGSAQYNMVKRAETAEHHNRPNMYVPAYRESIGVPDKQLRFIAEEFTQVSNNSSNLDRQKVIKRIVSRQLQSLGGNIATGSDSPDEQHKRSISPQDDSMNNVIAPDELSGSIVGEHFRCRIPRTTPSTSNGTMRTENRQLETSVEFIGAHTNPINPSTGNDALRPENQLEVSPETCATKPSEKRKVGRPRKEVKPGEKPKPRGRPRKEKIVEEVLMSNGSHTIQLQNEDVSCVSGTPAGGTSYARAISERVVESISGATPPCQDPLDLIIQKLTLLDINKSEDNVAAEPHGALVPYKGEFGTIVPFEGNVKRKRSRAKVDLDPVTTLMWKLLMGPDMSDGAEAMDKDKEKWLDEERKIFQGRVDSFIARMHLVQGDRRFSPWKGSVVDSVVGVFLTQNVSDHLSSSAFMALAAKFPVKAEVSEKSSAGVFHTTSEENSCCSRFFGEAVKLQGELLVEEPSNTLGSLITAEEKEGSNNTDLLGSSSGDGLGYGTGVYPNSFIKHPARLHENRPVAPRNGSFIQAENGSLEDVISPQNSTISSQNSPDHLFHMNDHMHSSTSLQFRAGDFARINMPIGTGSLATYTELLRMQEVKSKYNEKIGSFEFHEFPYLFTNNGSLLNDLRSEHHPLHTSANYHQNGPVQLPDMAYGNDSGRPSYTSLNSVTNSDSTQAENGLHHPSSDPGISSTIKAKTGDALSTLLYGADGSFSQDKSHFPPLPLQGSDLSLPIIDKYFQTSSSETLSFAMASCEKFHSRNESEAQFVRQNGNSNLREECSNKSKQIGNNNVQSESCQPSDVVGIQTAEVPNGHSSNLCPNPKANSEILEGVGPHLIENFKDAEKTSHEVRTDGPKAKKPRVGTGKKRTYDWDILRKEVLSSRQHKERGHNAKDTIDWETIRQANVKEISETIRERGMNNMLAERIKDFLNRLVRDHGSIDLEWLRYVEPDKAKDYLLSIRGLGLKSVECVRLLTLHHMAFPVDTNVGRICVRLGWVPLQPLPESLQLHLLEMYPMLENIQKYLWPRLCKLDQRTLYELHYQMITFGKVFCTKSKPNCNACPMRAECKHFASAFASARLALPGPEEKSLVTSGTPLAAEGCDHAYISFQTACQKEGCNQTCNNSRPVSQLEWNSQAHGRVLDNVHPIIEEPASPELESETAETKEDVIEDAFIDDPEDIPTIKLNFEEFTQNLKNYMQANKIEIEDADMSKALVAISPEAASIPTPKLKNVSRLRTEHQVYELPDTHSLLEGFDQREPDDPCPYLLSIWTPGETAQSTDAPKTFCDSQESGKLCESATCFSCNSRREAQAQTVRGTILIPCRTAMRGSFPLNGTYFQVNEVFADHDTSRNPINVARHSIWNLPRRTVYFGTSIPTIFKGLTTEEIQHCFWRGFVCVRGFDRTSRAPRPLYARLHFPASKVTRNKKFAASAAARDDE
ncbi:hypothetical protein ACP70R_045129 [Stipagrostis hirtigluma subsp. patula]